MNIIEIINDLQLSVGDSKRMACPVLYCKWWYKCGTVCW